MRRQPTPGSDAFRDRECPRTRKKTGLTSNSLVSRIPASSLRSHQSLTHAFGQHESVAVRRDLVAELRRYSVALALGKAWPRRTFLGPSKMLSANACPAIVFAKTSSRHPIGVGPYGRALSIGEARNTVVDFCIGRSIMPGSSAGLPKGFQ